MKRFLVSFTAFALVACLAVAGVIVLLNKVSTPATAAQRCTAQAQGQSWSLDPDQSRLAALIGIRAMERGMPARAATIALATAYQESKITNINYGDRDSLGIFQQRPSQGWGTREEVTDPVYATDAFYDVLAKVDGYESMAVTKAAQAVQRSAFPDAYADHEDMGRVWASALNGYSQASLTCILDPVADGDPHTPAEFKKILKTDLPQATASTIDAQEGQLAVEVDPERAAKKLNLGATQASRVGWAIAQWAVATAHATGATSVSFEDMRWDRDGGTWSVVTNTTDRVVVAFSR
ncbi:hypothetical protein [Rarobacter incanus]|uniref:Uncharacterized protein n=1 Tax=Rarobacter incanus TaxID=153494 RepID=A0A542SNA4_9MICO|nr:hypothetical protein [Rarobacter incanus]TQK76114.1 hypothetical protein FB389_0772 [Rarobacter incanus]